MSYHQNREVNKLGLMLVLYNNPLVKTPEEAKADIETLLPDDLFDVELPEGFYSIGGKRAFLIFAVGDELGVAFGALESTQGKKTYSRLNQLLRLAKAEFGPEVQPQGGGLVTFSVLPGCEAHPIRVSGMIDSELYNELEFGNKLAESLREPLGFVCHYFTRDSVTLDYEFKSLGTTLC